MNDSICDLLNLSLAPIYRPIKRWIIKRKLAHTKYELAYIKAQCENYRHVERVLQGRQAILQSELRNI